MNRVIAIGGSPGTGKTTLMRKFMEGTEWAEVEPLKMLPCLHSKERRLYIVGKYDPTEVFAGTDRLSMAVQPVAKKFFEETEDDIIFEGDRIFNASFLEHIQGLDKVLTIVYLLAGPKILKQRYKDRGSDQSETFLKGRETKYSNILNNFLLRDSIETFTNETPEDQGKVLEFLNSRLGK